MSSKSQYSSKILKKLAEKPAIPLEAFVESANVPSSHEPLGSRTARYATSRAIKNLVEQGCIEILNSDNRSYLKLTKKGKNKLNYLKLERKDAIVPQTWDGKWRIIILDIPEERKNEREALRYLLKKADFACVKNTVWISPHPYEHLFTNIKKDLNLSTELMIIVTNEIDEETRQAFLKTLTN